MKLSIVIATYDRARLLDRALASIALSWKACRTQPERSIEIIVADDGADETPDVVRAFGAAHATESLSVCYMRPEKRIGVNHARNQGALRASGKWVAFLDSDDEYVEGGLGAIFAELESAPARLSVLGFMTLREARGRMEPRGFRVGESWQSFEPSYEDIVLKKDIKGDIHYVFRKRIFSDSFGFPESVQGFESFFYARLAKEGFAFRYVNTIADRRYTDGHEHIGSYARWPKQYAPMFVLYAREHKEVLLRHPATLAYFYRAAGSAFLRARNPIGFYWRLRSLWTRLWSRYATR